MYFHFESLIGFNVHHSCSVTFFPLALAYYYSAVIKSSLHSYSAANKLTLSFVHSIYSLHWSNFFNALPKRHMMCTCAYIHTSCAFLARTPEFIFANKGERSRERTCEHPAPLGQNLCPALLLGFTRLLGLIKGRVGKERTILLLS